MSSDSPPRRSTRLSNKRTAVPDDGTESVAITVTKRRSKRSDTERASPQDALTRLTSSLSHATLTLARTVDDVITSINNMNTRAASATAACAADYDALLSALVHARACVLRYYHARSCAYGKWLDENAEEADTVIKQLDAVSGMCAGCIMHVSVLLASVGHVSKLAHSEDGDGARLCVPVSTLSPSALASMSTVWRELPDGAVSTVSGRGMKIFVNGATGATRNVVFVYPRVLSGAFAEYVKPEDVRLMLKDDAGALTDVHVTVQAVYDGCVKLAYTLSYRCSSKFSATVVVCGVAIGSVVTVRSGYDAIDGANLLVTYDLDYRAGCMAVNADSSMMAFSEMLRNKVHVFLLTPSFERVCVIGREGTGLAEFKGPCRLCFTPADTILVCDSNNDRVQQLTVTGEYMSSFSVHKPFSIAAHGDMVAVGRCSGPIEMHLLSTGELIRRFGSRGDGPGHIGSYASGIRFTPDGASLLLAEYSNRRLSWFTVDGVFLKHIGTGVLSNGMKDVSFGAGSEMIVADPGNHRICVFSPDGDTLIKTWGSYGTAAGQFCFPIALAVSGSYLYVMNAARVQVFE